MKVDVLALGMLTCIRKAFDLLEEQGARIEDMADLPPDQPDVYAMISAADTIGVFQIESRGADEHAAAAEAEEVLRPRDRGGDRAARPNPGGYGASLPSPQNGAGTR